ncbi:hypothetical protein PISMIDRAFT_499709 [Pisolithus microcarpus 441]|uniref:Uncharacterized protein n=1 Tax=Pisolithus microcarpus 441 TaxID=765257 RepID=A0A0C9YCR4_9AGAM|nr:hypothetical protein BKA83DRAFT_499709 [Pisolithus microcarpus]KIK22590.1 hypothetical protein PISMIDRAFT_499709 [Pisolithus microcarpus 441]
MFPLHVPYISKCLPLRRRPVHLVRNREHKFAARMGATTLVGLSFLPCSNIREVDNFGRPNRTERLVSTGSDRLQMQSSSDR